MTPPAHTALTAYQGRIAHRPTFFSPNATPLIPPTRRPTLSRDGTGRGHADDVQPATMVCLGAQPGRRDMTRNAHLETLEQAPCVPFGWERAAHLQYVTSSMGPAECAAAFLFEKQQQKGAAIKKKKGWRCSSAGRYPPSVDHARLDDLVQEGRATSHTRSSSSPLPAWPVWRLPRLAPAATRHATAYATCCTLHELRQWRMSPTNNPPSGAGATRTCAGAWEATGLPHACSVLSPLTHCTLRWRATCAWTIRRDVKKRVACSR